MKLCRTWCANQRTQCNAAVAEEIAFSTVGKFYGKRVTIERTFEKVRTRLPVCFQNMDLALNFNLAAALSEAQFDRMVRLIENDDPVFANSLGRRQAT